MSERCGFAVLAVLPMPVSPPLASAVFPSSCTSSFSPDIRRFLLFVLYCPVHGKVVGTHFLKFSTVRGGIAFLVEEEDVGL